MAQTEIIIIRFGLKDMEDECIESVKRCTTNYKLNVYDNFKKRENLGVLWNRLIANSKSDYICLLNSDTLVSPNWLDDLLEVFEREANTGCVGPTTNRSHNHQSKEEPETSYTVEDFDKYKEVLSGFCLVFPVKIWEEVGGFPEDFGFYGQECVFIQKILRKGYKQRWRKDVFVYHYGSASVKASNMNEQEERKLGNAKYQEWLKSKS